MMGSNTEVRGEKVMKQSKEEFIKSEGADFLGKHMWIVYYNMYLIFNEITY